MLKKLLLAGIISCLAFSSIAEAKGFRFRASRFKAPKPSITKKAPPAKKYSTPSRPMKDDNDSSAMETFGGVAAAGLAGWSMYELTKEPEKEKNQWK